MTQKVDDLIATQIEYYREMARSGRFDRSYIRSDEYALAPDLRDAWTTELAGTERSLATGCAVPQALELACGNGRWTPLIARLADHVVAVDSSPEMLAENGARTGALGVRYVRADALAWEPDQQFDVVVLCLWLSHVPHGLAVDFLRRVASWLTPGGRIFLMDSLPHPLRVGRDEQPPDATSPVHTRQTSDGRTFTIPKIYFTPDTLRSLTESAALTGAMDWSGKFFFNGWLTKD